MAEKYFFYHSHPDDTLYHKRHSPECNGECFYDSQVKTQALKKCVKNP